MERNERLKAADKCASKYTNENEAHIARAAFMLGCEFEAQGEIAKGVILETEDEHWKPSEDEERLINTSISFLKDFADKGYENAVECIGWLKSLRPKPQYRDTYYDIIHSILVMLKDIDFMQITPEHRVSLLNDIRVRCKHADEWADILDEPQWKPSEE